MFFFFFGDTKPEVKKVIERDWASCPRCGESADLVKYVNVYRAFFIPVWRSAGRNPAIACTSCSFFLPLSQFQQLHARVNPRQDDDRLEARDNDQSRLRCYYCDAPMRADDNYCSKCGKPAK